MGSVWRGGSMLALAAAAVVASPAADGSSVVPFPAGALPGWGALHTLCSLQCELRDPFTLTILDTPVTRNDSVCHSPVDAASLPGGLNDEVYPAEQRLGVRVKRVAARPGRPSGSLERDTVYDRLPLGRVACADEGGQGRITGEARVVDHLTLTRNTIVGSVARVNGLYEVLGVSRLTVGVCADTSCSAVVAVDMAAPGAALPCAGTTVGVDCAWAGTPVVTYRGTDGVERPVGAGRNDLLTLGRGVLGRHDWLGAAAAAALGVQSEVRLLNPQAALLPDGAAPPAFAGTIHRLNGTPPMLRTGGAAPPSASGGTVWLDAVAWVLCSGRRNVFARDGAVCKGVAPFIPERKAELNGETVTVPGILETGRGAVLSTFWFMVPEVVARAAAPDDAPVWAPGPQVNRTVTAQAGPRLPFLAARGLREINPDSPEERALGAALGRRTALLPVHANRNLSLGVSAALQMVQPSLDALEADLVRLAATYDSSVWGVEQPDPPVTDATIVLAAAVVVAELGTLFSLYVGIAVWESRAVGSFFIAAAVAALALAAFIAQYALDRKGDDWRVGAVRDSLLAQLTGGVDRAAPFTDLRGTVVVRTQTLLLATRNGYRPRLMLLLMIGAVVAYFVVAVGMLVLAWR